LKRKELGGTPHTGKTQGEFGNNPCKQCLPTKVIPWSWQHRREFHPELNSLEMNKTDEIDEAGMEALLEHFGNETSEFYSIVETESTIPPESALGCTTPIEIGKETGVALVDSGAYWPNTGTVFISSQFAEKCQAYLTQQSFRVGEFKTR
jgi:hypothetical protein